MLTSIISQVAMPLRPATGTARCTGGGCQPASASARARCRATCSSSRALKTMSSEGLAKPSSTACSALFETLAMAMVWNMFWMKGNTSPPAPGGQAAARRANSLQPPPAGIRPTPASTRPT
jgi:hypothetical protein